MGRGRRARQGRGRRGGTAAAAAAAAAVACGALLAAPGGVSAGAGFPTPPGYADLPPASECKIGCETLTMSGKELLERVLKRPEGGKKWLHGGHPIQKMSWDLGLFHQGGKGKEFKVAEHILRHLAELEEKVEAEHTAKTGIPASEASQADKHARLYEAYLKEGPLQYSGWDLTIDPKELADPVWADPQSIKGLHVNHYHQTIGLLRWPHFDWRSTPRLGKREVVADDQRANCKPESIPLYYISLVRRQDRRKNVDTAMKWNMPFEYVDAIDGNKELDLKDVHVNPHMKIKDSQGTMLGLVPGLLMQHLHVPSPYLQKYWSREVLPNEVALTLSLKMAFEQALGKGHEMALILEDDHVMQDTKMFPNAYCIFLKEVEALEKSGIEWDFIQAESYNWFGDDAANIPDGLSPWFVPLSNAHNTHTVLWHARGMRRMMEWGFFERCVMTPDEYLSYMTNPGRYSRKEYHECYGKDGKPPTELLKGFRWKGMRFIKDTPEQAKSSIDNEF